MLADLNTDTAGRRHDQVPPPLIRPDVVAVAKADAEALLAKPVADIFNRSREVFFQPIYDLASPRIVFGRTALLGDAAFVARPHIGAGVTKAALDAVCLADAVARHADLDVALAHYERERHGFGEWIVGRSRDLGAMIGPAPKGSPLPDRRPDVVMRRYLAMPNEVREWALRSLAPP
jgi:2-polyprenyl-6-methoxyphenol hydroxylase-like FAD-dependent oxidoreductase